MKFNPLIPEFTVAEVAKSLEFYLHLGFKVEYDRAEKGFYFLSLEGAQIMLEQYDPNGWIVAPLEAPFGRGINFQIEVGDIAPLLEALQQIHYPLFRAAEVKHRQVGAETVSEVEFLVQDPDGYLLRFSQHLSSTSIKAL